MTFQDPRLPDPGFGRNPPRHVYSRNSGVESALVGAIAAAAIIGIVIYSATDLANPTADNSPPSTTGQGTPRTMEPVIDKVRPVPAPPRTTVPSIDQNVPAEKIAPPIPAQPNKP
jgi:hypothetical protein